MGEGEGLNTHGCRRSSAFTVNVCHHFLHSFPGIIIQWRVTFSMCRTTFILKETLAQFTETGNSPMRKTWSSPFSEGYGFLHPPDSYQGWITQKGNAYGNIVAYRISDSQPSLGSTPILYVKEGLFQGRMQRAIKKSSSMANTLIIIFQQISYQTTYKSGFWLWRIVLTHLMEIAFNHKGCHEERCERTWCS